MENDPAHAKRLEDNLTRQTEFANPEPEVATPSEGRTDATKRARQDEIGPQQEFPDTGGASSCSTGADVDMRSMSAGKRPLEAGGDVDMVCGLDVCDELNEYSSDAYVNDCEGDGEVTGVTLLRDDVAKSTNGRDGVVREGQSLRRGDRRNNVCQERDTPISCRGEDIN